MLLPDILTASAQRFPNRMAVFHSGRWYTYGEIHRSAASVSRFLRTIDVQPGDRVAGLLENSLAYIVAHFGALFCGAVDVSLNIDLKAEDHVDLLNDCDAKVLITNTRTLERIGPVLARVCSLTDIVIADSDEPETRGLAGIGQRIHSLQEATRLEPDFTRPPRSEDDLACLVYTSGSTGRSKGVMLSHRNLVSNTRAIVEYLGLTYEDRMLVVLPFHYIYGRSLLYSHFLSSGSLVLDHRFAFPSTILDTLAQHQVTCFAGVPSTFSILLNRTLLRERSFPHLRLVTQAGGGMPPDLQQSVASAFAPAEVFIMYGATEASPRLTYVPPASLPKKWGSIGRPIPGVTVHIVDEEDRPVPPNTVGEIVARGPNIMLGYWKDPEGTARALRGGFYHTGDLGYADDEGFIFITGRIAEMIKTGGHRVSAKEVEDALTLTPGILEAAVVPVPDELLGESIFAFVAATSTELSIHQIHRALSEKLPAYKLPRYVDFLDTLPRLAGGKIDKVKLRSRARARLLRGETLHESSAPQVIPAHDS